MTRHSLLGERGVDSRRSQRLDGMCAEAQKESGIKCSFASEKSALLHMCDLDDGKKIPQPHR
jgi:hypothetical protein